MNVEINPQLSVLIRSKQLSRPHRLAASIETPIGACINVAWHQRLLFLSVPHGSQGIAERPLTVSQVWSFEMISKFDVL